MEPEGLIIAFDPGRNIGCAHVDSGGRLISQVVLNQDELPDLKVPAHVTVLVGDGTGSMELLELLTAKGLDPLLVDEEGTTLLARRLYWQEHPPQTWLKWLPPGMRPQPDQLDGYAAWALARRWLGLADVA